VDNFHNIFLVLNQFFLDFRKELKLDKKGRWNFESCASVVNFFTTKNIGCGVNIWSPSYSTFTVKLMPIAFL